VSQLADPPAHEAPRRTWEDLSQGDIIVGPGVTITDAHLVTWAGLTGDIVSLHLNEQYAATTQFGHRIAHGPLTLSLCLGLMTHTGYFTSVIAWLGLDGVRASKPVFIGDTIHPEATVTSARLTSKPGQGLWTLDYRAVNQNDETVMTFQSSFLVATKS